MFVLLEAIILGIVEGITEFLPVSSTGHIIVTRHFLGFKDAESIFTVVIQLGAMAAVIYYFRRDLAQRVLGLVRRDKQALRFWKLLAIATIPVGIAGLLVSAYMEQITTPAVIAATLIVGGFVLWWVDHKPVVRKEHAPEIDGISFKQAWIVGFSQCIALIPGVSRSAATIVGGLGSGMDRPTATAFSFYLGIPVMALASGYQLIAHGDAIKDISGGPAALLLGTLISFITALAAIAWLLRYVSRHNFKPFAYYRIILGIVILIWLV